MNAWMCPCSEHLARPTLSEYGRRTWGSGQGCWAERDLAVLEGFVNVCAYEPLCVSATAPVIYLYQSKRRKVSQLPMSVFYKRLSFKCCWVEPSAGAGCVWPAASVSCLCVSGIHAKLYYWLNMCERKQMSSPPWALHWALATWKELYWAGVAGGGSCTLLSLPNLAQITHSRATGNSTSTRNQAVQCHTVKPCASDSDVSPWEVIFLYNISM